MLYAGATLALLPLASAISAIQWPERAEKSVIHYSTGNSELSREAIPILDNIAAAWQQNRSAILVISAHTDRVGSKRFNRQLSLRRAERVRTYLRRRAVPAQFIEIHALDESAPAVPTADGIAEPSNRRVEIRFKYPPS